MKFNTSDLTHDGARALDASDPLSMYRGRFHLPRDPDNNQPIVYLAGNSLGLQMRDVGRRLENRLREWETRAVQSWHETDWMTVDGRLAESMARIVGAGAHEVAVTATLTSNLHVLMATFYRPEGRRRKIIMEAGPFPSDQYAAAGQALWHGLDPENVVLTAEETGDEQGVLDLINREADSTALVLLAGVNYYTGQVYDMERVTRAARARGCVVGLDLAHAAGNVPLLLHDWGVDFAAWCGYKYLNGGPGSPAGLFVHERHHHGDLPRLAGWWGHDAATRFAMPPDFKPESGAAGWQISTPPVLGLAPLESSLALFDEVGMEAILEKSRRLTAYLDALIAHRLSGVVRVVTPAARGAQLSLSVPGGRATFDRLAALGVVCDWREPDVVRAAPAPLYNNYEEMVLFVDRLEMALKG